MNSPNYQKPVEPILRSFIKWHLLRFLQKNNPNVIGLTEKLERPYIRDLRLPRTYWKRYLTNNDALCIYSGQILLKSSFSLDHFIPWSYIAHDQVWNIIPTSKSINSSKGNCLPDTDSYISKFCSLQFNTLSYHLSAGNTSLLDDYFSLLKENNLGKIDETYFRSVLTFEILTIFRTAKNLGFNSLYNFKH